jgi:hypothetical protein
VLLSDSFAKCFSAVPRSACSSRVSRQPTYISCSMLNMGSGSFKTDPDRWPRHTLIDMAVCTSNRSVELEPAVGESFSLEAAVQGRDELHSAETSR